MLEEWFASNNRVYIIKINIENSRQCSEFKISLKDKTAPRMVPLPVYVLFSRGSYYERFAIFPEENSCGGIAIFKERHVFFIQEASLNFLELK